MESQPDFLSSQHWKNLGCHVVPSDWATCHPVICLYGTVNMHGQLPRPCHTTTCCATSMSVLPSHLPRQHPYYPVMLPCQHLYNYLSSVLPCVSLSLGHVTYKLPHVIYVLVQLSSKTPKSSDKCHLLMLPHVPSNVICPTVDVNSTTY
jgi:hypothetical protein